MTTFDKPVTRRTVARYRVTVAGAVPGGDRQIVAQLHGDATGDWLTLREAGRRHRVTLDIAELYRKALIAEAAQEKREKGKRRAQ